MGTLVYVVRAEYGKYASIFQAEGYVAIGWFDADPAGWDLSDKEALKSKYRQQFPNDPPMRVNQNVGQIYRFVSEIQLGDVIVCPGQDNQLSVGIISGELYYSSDATSRFFWRRPVKWRADKIDRHSLSVPLQNTLRSTLTCFKVNAPNEILERIGLTEIQHKASDVATSNFIGNTELIRQRFLQLDATEFEYLVSYLLRTLGFEPSQEIGKVGDGGIDFEGVLDVSGIASINLQVQVKRFEKSAIGEKEIRNFRGALKKGFQGCFITLSKFNKKAIESASDNQREQIQLIDGNRFIDIFIEQYEKIIESMYNDDMDDLATKLKFKKSLLPV